MHSTYGEEGTPTAVLISSTTTDYTHGNLLPSRRHHYHGPVALMVDSVFIGYSLGGGILLDCSYFPKMIKSLVLLAPSGLIRPKHMGQGSILYSTGIFPEGLLRWL